MQFVNLTPHTIGLAQADGSILTITSSGLARVASTDEVVGSVGGLPLVRTTYGEVTGLGPVTDGVVYIVSAMVLDRTERTDVVAPDTGPTAIRKDGQVVAVCRLRTR
jgi:hypothetical protein